MVSELDIAQSQIKKLKAELEYECKFRQKLEYLNKRLETELVEERKMREELEQICDKLAEEILCGKEEMESLKREIEEERNMLKVAEELREERVHMKLAEAKILLEEKLLKLDESSSHADLSKEISEFVFYNDGIVLKEPNKLNFDDDHDEVGDGFGSKEWTRSLSTGDKGRRKPIPEPENPHILRGIKGFVEFPKVLQAIGSKNRNWDAKLECQRGQLKMLLKQKNPLPSNSLIF